ncbi:phytanoyl-CoA dioxygenase family protein [Priestia megaterium]
MLSEDELIFFQNNGFLVIENFFSEEEMECMTSAVSEVIAKKEHEQKKKGFYSGILNQHINTWKYNNIFKGVSLNSKIPQIAKMLLQTENIRLLQDHILIKPGKDSKATPWHQDFSYFPINETSALTAWIPFHSVNENNGCLSYMPGTNNLGKLEKIHMYNHKSPLDEVNSQPFIASLNVGSIVFHHSLTLHYAYPNITDMERMAYAIVYMKDGVTYNGHRHPTIERGSFEKNDNLVGENFPII